MTGWPLLILLALASLTSSSDVVQSCLKCGHPTGNKMRSHSQCAQTGPRKYFRDQHDCGKFYQCNRGTAYEFLCAEGLGFNEEKNVCEHIARVRCPTESSDHNNTHQLEHDFVRASGAGQRNSSLHDASSTHQLEHDFVRASGAGQRNSSLHDASSTHQLEYDFVRASGAGQRNSSTCNICQQAKEVIPRHANCPRTNGYYPVMFRNQKDCSQFYQCDNGHAYLIQCPAGLFFNTKLSVCDYPQHVDCNGPVLDKEVVSGASGNHGGSCCPVCQSATNVIRNHPDCPTRNGQHPVMFRHRSDCTKYYQCDNGAAFEIKCPAGLHFNTVLNVCDYPEKSGCSGASSSDNSGGSSANDSGHQPNQPCVICQGAKEVIQRHVNCPRVNGYYPVMFRNQKDCSQFYQCDHGNAYLVQCPAGLYFNTKLSVCDYPQHVDCNGPVLDKEVVSGASGNHGGSCCPVCQSAKNVIRNHPDCPTRNGQHPVMFRHRSDCTKYYQCDNGAAFEIKCPAGLHFNTVLNVCDYPEKSGCSGGSSSGGSGHQPKEPCAICQGAKEIIQHHANCPRVNGYYPVMFRNQKDCSQFYQCDHGNAFLVQCPAGLHFNTQLNVCDYPRNVDCNGPVLNEEAASGAIGDDGGSSCPVCQSATNVVRNHPDCPARNGYHPVMFRHTTDCTKYYQCDNGAAFEITCPARLHFNTVLKICDYPEKAGCSGVPSAGSAAGDETPTVSESVPKIHPNCPAITGKQEAAYWSHPHECDKYFGCKWGCVELLSCPVGHLWDDTKKACAPAHSVKCENAEW